MATQNNLGKSTILLKCYLPIRVSTLKNLVKRKRTLSWILLNTFQVFTFSVDVLNLWVKVKPCTGHVSHLTVEWSSVVINLHVSLHYTNLLQADTVRDARFGPKVGQIGPKWDKSGAFKIRFQCIWRSRAKCTEIWSEKAPDLSHLGPIWPTLEPNLPSVGLCIVFLP